MSRLRFILPAALIGLVICCAGLIAIRELGVWRERPVSQPTPPENGLVVYYFNGDFHCATCDNFEAYTASTLQEGFAHAFTQGRLQWRVVNVDRPENRHYVQEYRLVSRTIVLATYRDGKEVRWRSLRRIWDLADNEREFKRYIRDEVASELGARP